MAARIAAAIRTREQSGAWVTEIVRECGHSTTSPARFAKRGPAERHGRELLAHPCLQCALREVLPGVAA